MGKDKNKTKKKKNLSLFREIEMITSFPDLVSIHCACVLSYHMISISSYNYYMLIHRQGLIRKWFPLHHTFAFSGPNQDDNVKVKHIEKSCV